MNELFTSEIVCYRRNVVMAQLQLRHEFMMQNFYSHTIRPTAVSN